MIVCKIVDALNRTESLYHGLRLSPGCSALSEIDFRGQSFNFQRFFVEVVQEKSSMGSSSRSYGNDAEHWSNILRVLRPEDLNGTNLEWRGNSLPST
jgi:hypothetical protein